MDVDYRPMLWADASEMVLYYDLAVRMTDVLIGNELEITFAREAVRSGGQGGEAVAAGLRIPARPAGRPRSSGSNGKRCWPRPTTWWPTASRASW